MPSGAAHQEPQISQMTQIAFAAAPVEGQPQIAQIAQISFCGVECTGRSADYADYADLPGTGTGLDGCVLTGANGIPFLTTSEVILPSSAGVVGVGVGVAADDAQEKPDAMEGALRAPLGMRVPCQGGN